MRKSPSNNSSIKHLSSPEPHVVREKKISHIEGGTESSDESDERFFITTKVVMLGESGVGKSSILGKFAYGNFQPGCFPTVSPHFFSKVQTIYKLG